MNAHKQRDGLSARQVIEASVHLPRRGKRWVATYRDGSGRQFWRSTGLADRSAALILAQEWERGARQRRAASEDSPSEPVIRGWRGAGRGGYGLTQTEVALFLGISERTVREIEKRAFRKLRRHPALQTIWAEWIGEGAASGEDVELTHAEVAAVYGLARSRAERRAVGKIMALTAS